MVLYFATSKLLNGIIGVQFNIVFFLEFLQQLLFILLECQGWKTVQRPNSSERRLARVVLFDGKECGSVKEF